MLVTGLWACSVSSAAVALLSDLVQLALCEMLVEVAAGLAGDRYDAGAVGVGSRAGERVYGRKS